MKESSGRVLTCLVGANEEPTEQPPRADLAASSPQTERHFPKESGLGELLGKSSRADLEALSPREAALASLFASAGELVAGGDLEAASVVHEAIGKLLNDSNPCSGKRSCVGSEPERSRKQSGA